jgi:hypothetical protein
LDCKDGQLSTLNEGVMYAAPKSMSFGHRARAPNARAAWSKTLAFLERHTVHELRGRIGFECPRAGDGLDERVRDQYVAYVRSELGAEGGEPRYPSWDLAGSRFEQSLEVALNEDRWPPQKYGPARLHFCYDFVWRQVGEQKIMRDHAPNELPKYSWVGVSIGSHTVFLQPMFLFPYACDSTEVQTMLQAVAVDLPFRFSPHHFQRVFPSKQGRSYNSRKLPSDWLQSNKPLQPIARKNARSG